MKFQYLFFCVAPHLSLEKKNFFNKYLIAYVSISKQDLELSMLESISVEKDLYHSSILRIGMHRTFPTLFFFFSLFLRKWEVTKTAPLPGKKEGLVLAWC